jgi:hypothetical protein
LYAALIFPAPETVYVIANDLSQAQERVFDLIAKQVRTMGLVRRGAAALSATEILFPETGTRIVALPADFAGASGAIFGVSSWTELWAFRYEAHARLWEEMTPIPNRRSLRIVDSYAGFTGDSPILEPLWARALAGQGLDAELPILASGKLWAYIDTGEEAQRRGWLGDPSEMQAYYEEQAESLRPGTYARLHLNAWQSGEEAFVTSEDWEACVERSARPLTPEQASGLRLSVGVDAATKADCAAVVAVARQDDGRLRVVRHRIWTPKRGQPLDLEETIVKFVLELRRDYQVAAVLFDPYGMQVPEVMLRRSGLRMVEFPQTQSNQTRAGDNLWHLIRERRLAAYPDKELRQHVLNAVAVETGRGWRLAKEKASRKIDGVVALSMASVDAVDRPGIAKPWTSHVPTGRIDLPSRDPYGAASTPLVAGDRIGGLPDPRRTLRALASRRRRHGNAEEEPEAAPLPEGAVEAHGPGWTAPGTKARWQPPRIDGRDPAVEALRARGLNVADGVAELSDLLGRAGGGEQ